MSKIRSAMPAFALIAGGILLSPSAAPAAGLRATPISNGSAVVTVPDVAITMPGSINVLGDPQPLRRPGATLPALAAPRPPVSILPAGTVPGSSSLVTLDSSGIPDRALAAYRQAASLVDSADPGCHLDWALLAAIGRVESNHARFGGNQLDAAGVARPGIIGIALDGTNQTARILDTDRGLLDRDPTYDRAVGPMQFIPGTWRATGVDANADGVKNPQDMADAAASTAVYLCSGPGDLSRPNDLRASILRYNASDSYAQMVTSIAGAYRHGVRALPASDLAPAAVTSAAHRAAAHPATGKTATGKTATGKTAAKTPRPASVTPQASRPSPSTPASPPVRPQPSLTSPASTSTAPASPASSTVPPTAAVTCVPDPTTTASPSSTATGTISPTSGTPCVPAPCVPVPDATSTASPASTVTISPSVTVSPTPGPACVPPPCAPVPDPTTTAAPTPAALLPCPTLTSAP